jgi:hypothetical protein
MFSCSTELTGRVVKANERGFKIAGRTEWLNLSKFSSAAVPEVGQVMRIGLDRSNYVREVAPASETDAPASTPASVPVTHGSPDRLSARTAALSAAVRIVGRPTSVGAVLATALPEVAA